MSQLDLMSDPDSLKAVTSDDFALWQPFCEIAANYQLYLNSSNKRERLDYLTQIWRWATQMHGMVKAVLNKYDVHPREIRSIERAVRPTLTNHWLNLTQLYQGLVNMRNPVRRVQYLTSMFYLLKDLAELALVTETEPSKLLEV